MAEHIVKLLSTAHVTHNVLRLGVERPSHYDFTPGQATEVAINAPKWTEELRPFTFTGLGTWENLEFTIKVYEHNGVTQQLGTLKPGDELLLHDVFGAIHYRGEGTFIAGGAGVTPFIAIFRQLQKDGQLGNNSLIFSNNKEKDIILRDEFEEMLGNRFINTLTEEKTDRYDNRMIDEAYLKEKISDFGQYFYICGPDPMIEAVKQALENLGTPSEKIVTEEF
jgi:ferredoxin-NADP reductase